MSLNDETSLYFDLMKLAYIVRDPSLSIPLFLQRLRSITSHCWGMSTQLPPLNRLEGAS